MVNVRQQRLERVGRVFEKLPPWLQWALCPLFVPALFLSYFPVLTPVLSAVAALFLAYLKWAYLGEQLTWWQIGWLATGLLWFGVVLGYFAVAWISVGTIPLAIVVLARQWWEGRPFSLRDPEPDIPPGSRAELVIRSRKGKGLTPDHVRLILALREAQNQRFKPLLMIVGASFVLAFLGIGAAWIFCGRYSERTNGCVFFLCISTLAPCLFIYDGTEEAMRLRCRHCGRGLRRTECLERILESNSCFHCSGCEPLAARDPDKAAAPLWDTDIP
jgi:hypothetical protein